MNKLLIIPFIILLSSCNANGGWTGWGLFALFAVLFFALSVVLFMIVRKKKQASVKLLNSFSQNVQSTLARHEEPKEKIKVLKDLLDRIERDEKYRKTPDWKDKVLAIVYQHMAIVYYDMGEERNSIKYFTKVIELDPSEGMNYYNRGSLYNDVGEPEKALPDFNDAILLMPDYADAYNNSGQANYKLGRNEEALSDFNYALQLKESAITYYNRANLYYEQDKLEEAKEDYMKYLELDSDNTYDLGDYVRTMLGLIDNKPVE